MVGVEIGGQEEEGEKMPRERAKEGERELSQLYSRLFFSHLDYYPTASPLQLLP